MGGCEGTNAPPSRLHPQYVERRVSLPINLGELRQPRIVHKARHVHGLPSVHELDDSREERKPQAMTACNEARAVPTRALLAELPRAHQRGEEHLKGGQRGGDRCPLQQGTTTGAPLAP